MAAEEVMAAEARAREEEIVEAEEVEAGPLPHRRHRLEVVAVELAEAAVSHGRKLL